jgi:hypothetical protein
MNNTIGYVVEFGGLAVIAILLLAFYEKATAANYAAQAAAGQQNVWSSLEMNAGNSLINGLTSWSTRVPNTGGPAYIDY